MSNINLIIEERATQIGNFFVGRLLPFRQKRMVGPFIFIDHMKPAELNKDENFDVLPHPHIGLSTLTYLFEGAIMHRDSLGTKQEIKPEEINWMTAGKGVVHSERTPPHLNNKKQRLHGLQIWIALPKNLENTEPSFYHFDKEEIPSWQEENLNFKLLAGKLGNKQSPVPVHSPLYLLKIKADENQQVVFKEKLFGESGLYILEGSINLEGNDYSAGQMLIANKADLCSFELKKHSIVFIFGGDSFEEERFIDWNFVSSSKDTIELAKNNWIMKKYDKIPGDEIDYVPYPSKKRI